MGKEGGVSPRGLNSPKKKTPALINVLFLSCSREDLQRYGLMYYSTRPRLTPTVLAKVPSFDVG